MSQEPKRPPRVELLALVAIEPHPDNPRKIFSDVEVELLANSLERVSLLHPIHVQRRPRRRYRIISGERRWRAARKVNWQRIPAFVHTLADDAALEWMLEENFHRRNLSAIDTARAVELAHKRLGKTREVIATLCGMKSGGAVTNKAKLLELPEDWQLRIHNGELPERSGRALVPFVRAAQWDVLRAVAAAIDRDPDGWKDTATFEDRLAILAASMDARKPDAERTGPEPPNLFYFAGELVDLRPTPWRLAAKVWNSRGRRATVSSLEDELWPTAADITNRLKSAMNQVNSAFEARRWPLHLGRRGDYVLFVGSET